MKTVILSALTVVSLAGLPVGAQSLAVTDVGLLTGDTRVGPAAGSQYDLAIAQGGGQYLAVWSDARARQNGSQTIQSDGDIFGQRLDAAGQPIDAVPFLIAGGAGLQQHPKVAWNGANWLVVYESQDPTPPPVTYFDTYIRGVRVSPAGAVLDAAPLALPPDAFSPYTIGLTVAGQGGEWVIARCVYHADGFGTFLAGQRVSAAGALLDPAPRMLIDWVYGPVRLIANAGEYLAVGPDWNTSSTLRARRIAPNLSALAPTFNLPADTLAIAGDNAGGYYVTWLKNFAILAGSRMSSGGVLSTPGGTTLVNDIRFWNASITHSAGEWWVVRHAADLASAIRVASDGTRLDPVDGVPLPSPGEFMESIALTPRDEGGILFSWCDSRDALGSDTNGFVRVVSAPTTPGSESCLTLGSRNERSSDICAGPDGRMAVACVSELAGDDRVLLSVLGAAGVPEGPPIEVVAAPTIGVCGVAWSGSRFLVVWDEGDAGLTPVRIKARFLNADGTPDGAPFQVMPGSAPSVAALGTDFCVAGTRFGSTTQFINLWASRIDGASGALLDGPNGVMLGGGYYNGLTRTRAGESEWLVGAHSQWTHNSSQVDATLARVPQFGPPGAAFNPTPFSGGTGDLDIAFSGSEHLIVWRSNSLSSANNFISGRLMHADGTFGPAFTIAEAAGRQLRPAVTWNGEAFVVAWDDQREQDTFFDARTQVYGLRVSESAVILDPAPFKLAEGSQAVCSPALFGRAGTTTIATTRFTLGPELDSYRIGLSTLGEPPCPADLSGSSDPNDPAYGAPDGTLDSADFFYYLDQFVAGTLAVADLTGSSDPNDPAYGVPDGALDAADFFYYLDRFVEGCP